MRKAIFIGCLAVAFGFGFAGAFAIQEGPETGGQEWAPPPPLQDKEMDRWIGTWEWKGTMDMMGQVMPFEAKETLKWGLGHQYVISHYESCGPDGEVTYEALGIHRPNPEAKSSKLWWFDSYGTLTDFDGKQDGSTSVAVARTPQGEMRSTTSLNEDGTANHKMESKAPGSDEWKVMFEVKGTKKK
jgi:hypothetical protein